MGTGIHWATIFYEVPLYAIVAMIAALLFWRGRSPGTWNAKRLPGGHDCKPPATRKGIPDGLIYRCPGCGTEWTFKRRERTVSLP